MALTELETLAITIAKLQRQIDLETSAQGSQADRWHDRLGRDNGRDVHRGGVDLDALNLRLTKLQAQESEMIANAQGQQQQ